MIKNTTYYFTIHLRIPCVAGKFPKITQVKPGEYLYIVELVLYYVDTNSST